MTDTAINDKANRFAIAHAVASHKRRMWVSRHQYDEFLTSKQFTPDDMKCFIVVHPWPEPEGKRTLEQEQNDGT